MVEPLQVNWRETRIAGLVTAFLLIAFLPLVDSLPGLWRMLLGIPSAFLAAAFLGADCVMTEAGARVVGAIVMHVTPACSAARFFLLVLALFAGLAAARRVSFRNWLWLVPAAYGITLAANTSRLILCWYGIPFARCWVPARFQPGLHLFIGMLVFLPVLIVSYEVIQRRIRHAKS